MLSLLHPARRKKNKGSNPLLPSPQTPLFSCSTVSGHCCRVCPDIPQAHCPFTSSSAHPFSSSIFLLSVTSSLPHLHAPLLLAPSQILFLVFLTPFPPLPPLSLPPTSQPRALLGALARLLLTEEPLDLRHPCCLTLPRDKERGCEGPQPSRREVPLEEAGGGRGGDRQRGSVFYGLSHLSRH